MARKEGLGPRAVGANSRYRSTEDNQSGIPSSTGQYNPIGLRALIGTGSDFGPYILTQASDYYQGPSKSTRVKAHQFVPLDPDIVEKINNNEYLSGQFDASIRGHIYVKFWKSGSKGDEWKYGPCSLSDYRAFRESASKGRSIKMLEAFPHAASTDGVLAGI